MRKLMVRIVLTLATVVAAAVVACSTAGASTVPVAASIPLSGTTSSGGTFTGTLDVTGFESIDGQLVAVGTVSGTVLDAAGNVIGKVSDAAVAAPVQEQQQQGCTLFSFTLGPLDINVAGLVTVHVEPIGVTVRLEGLLGTLLCGLLGGGGQPPVPA